MRALGDASGSRTGVSAALCRPPPPPRPRPLTAPLSHSPLVLSLFLGCLPQSEPVSESYDE